jgi:hypothetical protein
MRGHSLRIFERAAGLKIGGDPGCTENVAAEFLFETGFCRRAADHADAGNGEIFIDEGTRRSCVGTSGGYL